MTWPSLFKYVTKFVAILLTFKVYRHGIHHTAF